MSPRSHALWKFGLPSLVAASVALVQCNGTPSTNDATDGATDGSTPTDTIHPVDAADSGIDTGISDTGADAASDTGPDTQTPDSGTDGGTGTHRVVLFVWDGLRPDSVNATDTPNLYALGNAGVRFAANHSTYPTFTMMNAASFATGSFPATTGFYGNTVYAPGATGTDATGSTVDFSQPAFTEDYGILGDLDRFYSNQLLLVGTLFQAAQGAGMVTVAVGKSGAAFIQDHTRGGYVLDERMAWPGTLVTELQGTGFALPVLTPAAYPAGAVTLSATNGSPTAAGATHRLADNATPDPTDTSGTPYANANAYMMDVYLRYLLPQKRPQLSVVWFRNPDSTEHAYGPGSANYRAALQAQDALLGRLVTTLSLLGMDRETNIIVVSDHGHSSVSGAPSLFPLRAVTAGAVGAPSATGYSVSGDVRLAHLLRGAGFYAFDGTGCVNDPVLSGVRADGTPVYPPQTDTDGSVCGHNADGTPRMPTYTTPSYRVPATLDATRHAVIIAANGGSDYVYLPDHDAATLGSLVSFLQSREQFGAIFVARRYGSLAGTLPLDRVRVEGTSGRSPDLIVSYTWDDTAMVNGLPGIEYESMFTDRGMHGSFSTVDVHNTLVAAGPDFAHGLVDMVPSGNVDVAPTIASILGLALPNADGRALVEALPSSGVAASSCTVTPATVNSDAPATGLTLLRPTSVSGEMDGTAGGGTFSVTLQTQQVQCGTGSAHTYFDSARAVRTGGT